MERKPLRIGIFTDTYYPTINGVSASTKDFAEELSRLGHRVYIFCPRYRGSKNLPATGEGPCVAVYRCLSIPIPTNPEHGFTFPSLGFGVQLRELGLDIIHIQDPFTLGVFGLKLARRLGIPLTQTYHTFWEHYLHYFVLPMFITRPIMVRQNAAVCNASMVNLVPSQQMIEGLRGYGVSSRLVACPTGIDPERMNAELDRPFFDSHLGIPKDRRIVLFASRMTREKSPEVALEAFALVARELKDVHLVMTGSGPFFGAIKRMVAALGLGDRVSLMGYLSRPELYACYAAADVFLFPSVSETQGLVVLEAQAFGTPVVGVAEMGVAMLLAGDKGGFLAPDRDQRVLADLCLRLLRDGELYALKSREAEENAQAWKTSTFAKLMEGELYRAIEDFPAERRKAR